ncbi:MAG: nuclear transport factor 2 family protein [Burkholderiales bacterium]
MSEAITQFEALEAEALRYKAQTSGDFAALEKMIGDDLVYYHSSAVIDDKASYIESMRSGLVTYRNMTRGEVNVRCFDSIAIITGNAKFEVTVKDQEKTLDLLFHAIWAKREGAVQFVSWQSTRRA